MNTVASLLLQVAEDVLRTFQANWVFLLLSIVTASAIQVFVGTDRLARWLRARTPLAVAGAVTLAALTPFCSCGTTAIVLGALASRVPWAPVVAFMVSSPLTSPGEYVLSVGLFGQGFATTYFVAAFALGLTAGWVTHHLERLGALRHQHRVGPEAPAPAWAGRALVPAGQASATTPAMASPAAGPATPCDSSESHGVGDGCGTTASAAPASAVERDRGRELVSALLANGRRLAILFFGFTALGYLLVRLVPTEMLMGLLGEDSALAVPAAAVLGIPVYVNTEGSLPLVASLMDGGLGTGAAMAFLVTGAGTSVGAVSGMLLIARWRVVTLVVASLLVGAVVAGYLTPMLAR